MFGDSEVPRDKNSLQQPLQTDNRGRKTRGLPDRNKQTHPNKRQTSTNPEEQDRNVRDLSGPGGPNQEVFSRRRSYSSVNAAYQATDLPAIAPGTLDMRSQAEMAKRFPDSRATEESACPHVSQPRLRNLQ